MLDPKLALKQIVRLSGRTFNRKLLQQVSKKHTVPNTSAFESTHALQSVFVFMNHTLHDRLSTE